IGEGQHHEFEVDRVAVSGAADETCDHAGLLAINDADQLVDRLAAVFAPERGEGFTFDLTAEQRADARAGETEAQLINKVARQHECVAKRVADRDWVDVGACRRRAGSAPFLPMREYCVRGCMFHCRHLFRHETAAMSLMSPNGALGTAASPRRR